MTIDELLELNPCHDRKHLNKLAKGKTERTVLEILKMEHVPIMDRLWVGLHKLVMTQQQSLDYIASLTIGDTGAYTLWGHVYCTISKQAHKDGAKDFWSKKQFYSYMGPVAQRYLNALIEVYE